MMFKKLTDKSFYPIFLASFPAVSLFAHNFSELSLKQLINPLIVSISIIVGIWAILNFFWPNRNKTALISTALFLIFSSYGNLSDYVKKIGLDVLRLNQVSLSQLQNDMLGIYILTSFAAILLLVVLIKKRNINFKTLNTVLNIISLSILIIPLSTIAITQKDKINTDAELSQLISNSQDSKQNQLPDIYYIIVDRYADNLTLEKYYKYDNSQFLNFLKSKGFYIADKSKANYHMTKSSLASSLNMNYLDSVIKQINKASTDETPLEKAIENNLVVSYLKTKGYKYLHFGAPSFTTAENKNADFTYVYMTRGITSDRFMKLFLDQVLLKPIDLSLDSLTYSLFLNSASLDPRRIKYETQFDQLEKVVSKVESKSPKFVFLHSLLTHPPYVIDTNGAYVPESLEASKGVKEKYINQLAYSNKLLKQAIETILAKSKTPPVIILQADEGPYPEIYLMKEDKINWQNADKDALQEKFGILNAYYLPEVGNKMLYPKITPVNTFRVIFNQYFKEDFPLLEDRSYVPLAFSYPYNLFDLTNQLK